MSYYLSYSAPALCHRKSDTRYQALHILMHGFCHNLTVGNGFDYGSCAVYHIAGGKNTRTGSVSCFVCNQKTTVVGFKTCGSGYDPVLGSLADRNNHSLIGNLHRGFIVFKLVLMVADKAADSSQRVIFKKNPSCFVQLVIFLKPDYLRNRGANGAAFLTLWNFTAQTAVCFVHNMQCHMNTPL